MVSASKKASLHVSSLRFRAVILLPRRYFVHLQRFKEALRQIAARGPYLGSFMAELGRDRTANLLAPPSWPMASFCPGRAA